MINQFLILAVKRLDKIILYTLAQSFLIHGPNPSYLKSRMTFHINISSSYD